MLPANQLSPLEVGVAGRLAKGREAQVLNAETSTHDVSSMAVVHWQIHLQPIFANKLCFYYLSTNTKSKLDAKRNYLQTDIMAELESWR